MAATALAAPQSTVVANSTLQQSTPAATAAPRDPANRPGPGSAVNDHGKYLADALGITQEALQTAQTKAHEGEIQAAVKASVITQEQADAMLKGADPRGGPRVDFRKANIDQQKPLALGRGVRFLCA